MIDETRFAKNDSYVQNLVIGSGIAGLMLALKLSQKEDVLVLTKGPATESNSWYAQGGIASVLDKADSFEEHIYDTIEAGAHLCHAHVVETVVRSGPRLIRELMALGVPFSQTESGEPHLTREGGHSQRRVVHAKDTTGQAVMASLLDAVRRNARITLREHCSVVDLLTSDRYAPDFSQNRCLGAYVLESQTGAIKLIRSEKTYLCTGGHGKIYLYTSNPDLATGDGVALGWRAGCKVANLEFMQFHPTCLYHPTEKTFLISEAVRGEGGILRDRKGRDFMGEYHPMASLAPRDIVARAIDTELKKSGDPFVYLDITHLPKEKILDHFPNIYQKCLDVGIDIAVEMIPVVPAAHYSCGGLVVDLEGRTNIEGLYALGETACTGLHGANRLASNSLIEALVFADRTAAHVLSSPSRPYPSCDLPEWNQGQAVKSDELVVLSHLWDEIRRLMWNYVGIVRTDKRLQRALFRINGICDELEKYYWDTQVGHALLEVRNLALVAQLTVRCALRRKESRGIHFNLDYPFTMAQAKDTVLR